jgi:hypothetical protein
VRARLMLRPKLLRCRRTDARNAARGSKAWAKTSTEKELCSPVQRLRGERLSPIASGYGYR